MKKTLIFLAVISAASMSAQAADYGPQTGVVNINNEDVITITNTGGGCY